MDLTPRLLTEVEFREEWRGYKREDVDDFLERVAAAVGELQERLRDATERAGQAERRLLEQGDQDEIRRTLVLAQRTALTAVEEARTEAERILAEANEHARRQRAEAEARVAAAEQEVAARAREDLAELAARRATLQSDVDALTRFFEEHRARLRAELERQLADLDSPNAALAVPAAPDVHDVDLDVPEHEPVVVPDVAPEPAPELDEPAVTRAPTEEEVAKAREDLVEALRRAGVEDLLGEVSPEELTPWQAEAAGSEPGAEATEPTPEPEADAPAAEDEVAVEPEDGDETNDGPRLYDADDESGEIDVPLPVADPTGMYDALADGDDEDDDEIEWREPEPPPVAEATVHDDDDPFLAELRRAVTDTEPLGPRDEADLVDVDDEHDEAVPSGRFRLRRGR